VGTIAGYFSGWLDTTLVRVIDIFLAFPRLVMALAFAAALGPGIENAVMAIRKLTRKSSPFIDHLPSSIRNRSIEMMMLFESKSA
jgi:ABC-type antimicrobial peptide transport system permease subunit